MVDNRKAFIDMIAWSEGTSTITESDDGYNVLVGSTNAHPLLFTDYSTHPNILNRQFDSTAAGRYQIIHPTFILLQNRLGTIDFTPATQDKMAIELCRDALRDIDDGNFETAVSKICDIWASLPGGNSGQREQDITQLCSRYKDFGGTLA